MIDVFTEEVEVQIKQGISSLYWFKGDLKKCWLRSGVDEQSCDDIFAKRNLEGQQITKRQMMDELYSVLRDVDYNRRLEISRNFVRILVEHENFVPQNENHRIEQAERAALKLRQIIDQQKNQAEYRDRIRVRAQEAQKQDYHVQLLKVSDQFLEAQKLEGQQRGYAFEKLFPELMRFSGISVEEPFKIVGEQIDGAIKYDSHFYLVELKWEKKRAAHVDVSSLYMKVEGKMEARGIFISMEGYSKEIIESLPKGKNIKVLFLDGIHVSNVIFGIYTIQELLEHAINEASLKANIYCTHDLT